MPQTQSTLPTYRAYHLGGDGRIVAAEVIPASNDEDAKAFAKSLQSDHQIELWECGRRLAIYPQYVVATSGDH